MMADIQLGSHTVKSHGMKVATFHMHDWITLLLLVVIEVVLNVIEPFHRFVGRDMMADLRYPAKSNTVPVWAVPVSQCIYLIPSICSTFTILNRALKSTLCVLQMIAILLPIVIHYAVYFRRRDVYDLHHATLGLSV